jgi:hypothetical protein
MSAEELGAGVDVTAEPWQETRARLGLQVYPVESEQR